MNMSRITHEIFADNHARTQFERGYAKIECVITLNTSPKQVPKMCKGYLEQGFDKLEVGSKPVLQKLRYEESMLLS